jgi:hypothetical protein
MTEEKSLECLSGRASRSDELEALAARCEREEPSPPLDHAIWEATRLTDGRQWVRFTTSLDAAVTLVPEGAQEVVIRVFPSGAYVRITTTDGVVYAHGEAKATSLALCAAALRARAALSEPA